MIIPVEYKTTDNTNDKYQENAQSILESTLCENVSA